MRAFLNLQGPAPMRAVSAIALAVALAQAAPAYAQSDSAATPAQPAAPAADDEIVVSGSRVDRAGFDAPTPTTVIGETELRQGDRPSIAQVLNDLPQFRATVTPMTTVGSTSAGTSTADLRSLGSVRTLILLDGRRFVGSQDLNNVPVSILKRVEVVTGGASAAWGSGAVAGVVNLIVDDEFQGFKGGVKGGISSRNDAERYGGDFAWGTKFANGRGHFLLAGDYLNEQGTPRRNGQGRPNLDSAIFTTATGQLLLANDVNFIDATPGGVIRSGALAGQTFNSNGTLGPVVLGSQSNATTTIGGNSRSQRDYYPITAPYERYTLYGRASFEVSEAATFWADAAFTRYKGSFVAIPELSRAQATSGGFVMSRDNAFLSPAVRAQLASGPATFRLGRILGDVGPNGTTVFETDRKNFEVAVGVEGQIGESWRYSAHFGHGEVRTENGLDNQRITANFLNAIDAVTNTAGQIVCRVALTTPGTACRPYNIFGEGNASPEAIAYAFGRASSVQTAKLDTTGVDLRGDPFSSWAGPVSIAVGVEARWESFVTDDIDPLSRAGAFGLLNPGALAGKFNVAEGFGEIVFPVLNEEGVATAELNAAGRYSEYSNSGGIWSYKLGATTRLFNDLLLRAGYSRDIRSPSISELFTTQGVNIGTVLDPFRSNTSASFTRYTGGNPNLAPEAANTLTIGASYSPAFARGLNVSVDYYKIDIKDVIATISAQDSVNQCFLGNQAACATIVRDSSGIITTMYGTFVNLAAYRTRGVDVDISYTTPMENLIGGLPGSLRLRALANYVDSLVIDNGITAIDRAGDVGDSASFTTPKWRATGSLAYQSDSVGFDLRLRYVGGGKFDSQQAIVNNEISSRFYVDLGVQYSWKNFTLYGSVSNVFDRDPPFVTTASSSSYDVIGRYFSGGVKIAF